MKRCGYSHTEREDLTPLMILCEHPDPAVQQFRLILEKYTHSEPQKEKKSTKEKSDPQDAAASSSRRKKTEQSLGNEKELEEDEPAEQKKKKISKKHREAPPEIQEILSPKIKIIDDVVVSDTQLGSGSYATVYLATYKKKQVAVKELQKWTAGTIFELKNEIGIHSLLDHPNIIQFIGLHLSESGKIGVIVEYCECGSLFDFLYEKQETNKLPKELQYAWMDELLSALDYLHNFSTGPILYRDMKSRNILLSKKGEILTLKLCDFGTAKKLGDNEMASTMIGTFRWLAPEVMKGERYSVECDIYSLAVTLYEIFVRKLPFWDSLGEQSNPAAEAAKIPLGLRPTLPDNLPQRLTRIIEQCWSDDPALRPPVRELIARVARYKQEAQQRAQKKGSPIGTGFTFATMATVASPSMTLVQLEELHSQQAAIEVGVADLSSVAAAETAQLQAQESATRTATELADEAKAIAAISPLNTPKLQSTLKSLQRAIEVGRSAGTLPNNAVIEQVLNAVSLLIAAATSSAGADGSQDVFKSTLASISAALKNETINLTETKSELPLLMQEQSLAIFYKTFQSNLLNVFVATRSISGLVGDVAAAAVDLAKESAEKSAGEWARDAVELAGQLVPIPYGGLAGKVLGKAIEKIVDFAAEKVTVTIKKAAEGPAKAISGFVAMGELSALSELIARRFTQRFAPQISQFDDHNDCQCARDLAGYTVMLMFSLLSENEIVFDGVRTHHDVAEAMLNAVCGTAVDKPVQRTLQSIKSKLLSSSAVKFFIGNGPKLVRKSDKGLMGMNFWSVRYANADWHCLGVVAKSGVRTVDGSAYISPKLTDFQLYGWRWGTEREVQKRSLTLCAEQKGAPATYRFFAPDFLENEMPALLPSLSSSSASLSDGSIKSLSVEEVCELLREWGLDEYESVFRAKNVKGAKLLSYIEDTELLEKLVCDTHDRAILLRRVKQHH
eukprot:TRINITY_DN2369_c1_g1_i2.p1 TRINITY_DN2369_c1_g1~~TRINITY_DN2369_c1_g1_i2.p1  ORF type:complete len:1040 (+),score=265.55 TRINITY_DN2369_c1_g1_i2:249-3122(+)